MLQYTVTYSREILNLQYCLPGAVNNLGAFQGARGALLHRAGGQHQGACRVESQIEGAYQVVFQPRGACQGVTKL